MGCILSNQVLPHQFDEYQPEIYLQKGEKVVRQMRATKVKKPKMLERIVLIICTFGLYFFIEPFCRRVVGAQILTLTNRRLMSWEVNLPGDSCFEGAIRSSKTESFQLSKLAHCQFEYVKTFICCGIPCVNTKPYTTMRFFFNEFPQEVPAYNPSRSLFPLETVIGDVYALGRMASAAAAPGFLGMLSSLGPITSKLMQLGGKLMSMMSGLTGGEEVLLPGLYIEMDTKDKDAFENAQTFLKDVMLFYPHRSVINSKQNHAAVRHVEDPSTPLFQKSQGSYVVNVTPAIVQFAPDETVLDSTIDPVVISIWDWLKCFYTLGIYYFFVIRHILKYKGALILTDRRLISVYTVNTVGPNGSAEYIQNCNSFFFQDIGTVALLSQKPDIPCLACICCEKEVHSFMVSSKAGTLSVTPHHSNGQAKIIEFFSKFAQVAQVRPLLALPSPPIRTRSGMTEGVLLPGEGEVARASHETAKKCVFMLLRTVTCGLRPVNIVQTMVVTSHRLVLRWEFSNGLAPNYDVIEYFIPLSSLMGTSVSESVYHKKCMDACTPDCCLPKPLVSIKLLLGKKSDWNVFFDSLNVRLTNQNIDSVVEALAAIMFHEEDATFWAKGVGDVEKLWLKLSSPPSMLPPTAISVFDYLEGKPSKQLQRSPVLPAAEAAQTAEEAHTVEVRKARIVSEKIAQSTSKEPAVQRKTM